METTTLLSLATISISISTAAGTLFIAYRQWRNADYKLKLELYHKRFEVFDTVRKRLEACRDGPLTQAAVEYPLILHEARFLFGEDVLTFLHHAESWVATVYERRGKLEMPSYDGEPLSEAELNKHRNALNRAYEYQYQTYNVFMPYLDFQAVGLKETSWLSKAWRKVKTEMDKQQ